MPLLVEAARGGVRMIQVREKDLPPDELRALICRIRDAVPASVLLTVNSSVAVARTLRLGLHLPASAAASPKLRALPLIGRSVHDEREAGTARDERVDYVLVSPVFPTESKPGHPGAGVELIRALKPLLDPIPIFALGGINVANAPRAVHAGAHGVAVCGAILSANHPRRVAEGLSLALAVARGDPE